MLKTLQGKILASLLIGLAVVIVMGLVSDAREVARDLRAFRWELLPAILGLTLLNYLLRGWRWQRWMALYGRRFGVVRGMMATIVLVSLVAAIALVVWRRRKSE